MGQDNLSILAGLAITAVLLVGGNAMVASFFKRTTQRRVVPRPVPITQDRLLQVIRDTLFIEFVPAEDMHKVVPSAIFVGDVGMSEEDVWHFLNDLETNLRVENVYVELDFLEEDDVPVTVRELINEIIRQHQGEDKE